MELKIQNCLVLTRTLLRERKADRYLYISNELLFCVLLVTSERCVQGMLLISNVFVLLLMGTQFKFSSLFQRDKRRRFMSVLCAEEENFTKYFNRIGAEKISTGLILYSEESVKLSRLKITSCFACVMFGISGLNERG